MNVYKSIMKGLEEAVEHQKQTNKPDNSFLEQVDKLDFGDKARDKLKEAISSFQRAMKEMSGEEENYSIKFTLHKLNEETGEYEPSGEEVELSSLLEEDK